MTRLEQQSKYVMTQLTVYWRKKYPYWSIVLIGVFLLIAKLDNGKSAVPVEWFLPWLVMFLLMINVHLVISPFFTTDDELSTLWLFPLNWEDVIVAKHIESAVILGGYIAFGFILALLIFPLTITDAANGILYFSSSLITMVILGDLPIWPLNMYRGTALKEVVLCSLALAVATLPFAIARMLPWHGAACGAWIVLSFATWKLFVLPKSGGWVIEKKFKRDES
jgi:hypothetical protein